MIDLNNTVCHLHYRISLTAEAKLDLQWWLDLLPTWLGKSLILNTTYVDGHLYQQRASIQMTLVYMDGVCTVMGGGSNLIGHMPKARWILHGRSCLP